MYDIVIIGAGPAGLTSALYALRANKKVLILEAKSYGGQIINASMINNYPAIKAISGFDFATNLYEQVKSLGALIKYETVLKINEDKTVLTDKNKYKAKAIIIATGSKKRKLNLENEDYFVGKGISYCATCDGNFYKNKTVAVVGGGNSAFEDAIYLSSLAKKVYLIHRKDEFRGEQRYIQELKEKKNAEFILNSTIISLQGKDELESIKIKDNKKEEKQLIIDGLFVAIGSEPNNEVFCNVVDLDENGYIKTTNDVLTKTPGIYAVGDARKKELRQLTTAVSDGSIAASMAIKNMKGEIKNGNN